MRIVITVTLVQTKNLFNQLLLQKWFLNSIFYKKNILASSIPVDAAIRCCNSDLFVINYDFANTCVGVACFDFESIFLHPQEYGGEAPNEAISDLISKIKKK